MKNIVITGSTSGIGYGLSDSFLRLGCSVTICGRSQDKIQVATKLLSAKHEPGRIFGVLCDVLDYDQVQKLWDSVKAHFGQIDIWINNAGVAHPETAICDYNPDQVKQVIGTNIIGAINGSIVAIKGMKIQGFGSIYNMEGLGSDGRLIKGMGLYGTSKSAVSYLTKAMALETKGTPILIGGIRPGMVATKLITEQYKGHPEEWERVRGIFNILSDRVETVTPWLACKILDNTKNGATITWLTRGKLISRFLSSPFHKRKVFD